MPNATITTTSMEKVIPVANTDVNKCKVSKFRCEFIMNPIIREIENAQLKAEIPAFNVGDTVRVDVKIVEGKRERIQAFEGLVMAIQGSGISKTFTVRKVSGNVGTEKTLPVNSPRIDMITVVRKGKVRQAKLGYIRKSLKTPKIKERV